MKNVDPARFSLTLVVLDDHSTPECVAKIKTAIAHLPFESKFIPLGMKGGEASFASACTYAKDAGAEILYFALDDYLHAPSALPEMLEAQKLFSRNLGGQEVAISPVDHPTHYAQDSLGLSHIVVGPERHWKIYSGEITTFLISKNAFMNSIEHFMKTNTAAVWQNSVRLFKPVPTLALHMQSEATISPFIDWKNWWNTYAN